MYFKSEAVVVCCMLYYGVFFVTMPKAARSVKTRTRLLERLANPHSESSKKHVSIFCHFRESRISEGNVDIDCWGVYTYVNHSPSILYLHSQVFHIIKSNERIDRLRPFTVAATTRVQQKSECNVHLIHKLYTRKTNNINCNDKATKWRMTMRRNSMDCI